MPCIRCNGYWQCSEDGELDCQMGGGPIEVEEHCFVIETKKEDGKCKMKVSHKKKSAADDDDAYPTGDNDNWNPAGEVCFKFQLFSTADGVCYVTVE